MASRAINSSVVSVISVATRNADRDLSQGGPRHATEIETNSTTKGKASGMALQGKGKRSEGHETVELCTSQIQSHFEDVSANHRPSPEEIRLRAHEIYLERGALPGKDLDDWLQAERELHRAAPSKSARFSVKGEA